MSLQSVCQCNERLLSELIEAIKTLPSNSYQAEVCTDNSQAVSQKIGAHVRHIIEFYQCFFAGLEHKQINYDERKRDPECEINRVSALKTLLSITQQLASLASNPSTTINLALSASIDTEGNTVSTESSPVRELLFLQSHATHHMAMINLLFQASGNEPPKDLGVATSTLIYRKEQAMSSD
ncbi:DinB family protein [Endozoicomonas sp.]|uniref:DinB family protein n=1 Tax=Endozoicomonas sp. TaxID=1892382 RepID=UPI002887B743|nr:DinB family protein [Endozoicomonas sp.]